MFAALADRGTGSPGSGLPVDRSRGRSADSPAEIPLRGWKDVLLRVWREFNADNITIIAGGVTFSVLLAIFPALGAFVALYGLVGDVNDVPGQIQFLSVLLPHDMVKFVGGEMIRLARARSGGLSLALIVGLLVSFWSANGAMRAVMVGLNVAYEEHEKRGFLKATLTSLAFTFGLLVFGAATITALGAGSVVAAFLGKDAELVFNILRWPLLVLAFAAGLSILYRFGPSRQMARWRWITWGSAAATALWLLSSVAFSFYVGRFAHYDRTYGSLGTVIGLMVWIWLSAIIVLAGAEMNAELEHQTAVDSTTGNALPLGARGAKMADTVAG
ncbi:MAG: YihY/virulence factor BrkB family protein [Caulobacteraceae bacterium]|nr:YihY/virulence factor BrkB family protein [Caulobacteraceae bacterium]